MSDKTKTAAVETPAPKKSAGKLPENLYYKNKAEEIVLKPATDVIASIVKLFKVKMAGDKTAEDIVKTMLLLNLRSSPNQAELPEGFEDASKLENAAGDSLADFTHAFATKHIQYKLENEEQKNTEKQAAAEAREAAKQAKVEENKKYQAEADEFSEMLVSNVAKQKKTASKITDSLIGAIKFSSDKVSMVNGGMGVVLAKGSSKADIANAAAVVLSAFEGVKNAEGAIQFIVGDLVNASVEAKVFRTQNEAASGLKHIISDKCQKTYQLGTIQQYAMMAARIPAEQRKLGIAPSLYLAAAKVTIPRIKDARPGDEEAANAEVIEFRNELIEDINSGSVNTKDIATKVNDFKVQKGYIKPVTDDKAEINRQLHRLFMSQWLGDKLANKQDKVVVGRGRESYEYTLAELVEIKDEAMEYLEGALLKEYDIDALVKGTKIIDKNGKSKEVPYRISDPFFVAGKKEAEPLKIEEVEKVEEEEVEEEEEEDDSDI